MSRSFIAGKPLSPPSFLRRSRGRPTLVRSLLGFGSLLAAPAAAEDRPRAPQIEVEASVELGALAALSHTVRFSRAGTRFDYVDDGGQDVLFPFARLQLDLRQGRHRVSALYQPLELASQVSLAAPLTVDDYTFPEQAVVDVLYSFPFYRLGYRYAAYASATGELSLGGALQIRNATLNFAAADGSVLRSNRDIGPVPLLSARWHQYVGEYAYLGAEVDGFYAPVKYLNGGDSDVVGAIVDASIRAGVDLSETASVFANLRWLGGGAEGTGTPDEFGDGYTENWLNFATVSFGVRFGLR